MTGLAAHDLTVGYDGRTVLRGVEVAVDPGGFTVIVGPNGSGKSTLLAALSRGLRPTGGRVLLDGGDVAVLRTRELARRLALLPQTPLVPEGIRVAELVARGRFPHRTLLGPWNATDQEAVDTALARTGTTDLADRPVDELSGGQRQRVWIALVLAQRTPLLLLDEPTTALDLAHQVEVLRLCRRLHREGTTVVAVLHDLDQALRYATRVVVLADGAVVAQGPPAEVITADLVHAVFGVRCRLVTVEGVRAPVLVPVDDD